MSEAGINNTFTDLFLAMCLNFSRRPVIEWVVGKQPANTT